MNMKNYFLTIILSCLLLISFFIANISAFGQTDEGKAPEDITQQPEKKETRGFLFFKKNEELSELNKRHEQEENELREKIRKERKELIEKIRKERGEEKKKKEFEKAAETSLNKRIQDYKQTARKEISERRKDIREAKKAKRLIDILSNEDDPLYIEEAKVIDSKTKFLKIKDIEYNYQVELYNQTPKIINSALIIWERRIPFTESLTIMKETIISKPIIPYEKRIVEYNDLNSKRTGEAYRVRVVKVTFEDGSQWKNPTWQEPESELSYKE